MNLRQGSQHERDALPDSIRVKPEWPVLIYGEEARAGDFVAGGRVWDGPGRRLPVAMACIQIRGVGKQVCSIYKTFLDSSLGSLSFPVCVL